MSVHLYRRIVLNAPGSHLARAGAGRLVRRGGAGRRVWGQAGALRWARGATQVDAGSDLTANHIIQSALIIGGTASSAGLVTIDASDASGNPLVQPAAEPSGTLLSLSVESSEPFGGGMSSPSDLDPLSAQGFNGDLIPAGSLVDGGHLGGNLSAVPEPATLFLFAIGSLACLAPALRCRTRRC